MFFFIFLSIFYIMTFLYYECDFLTRWKQITCISSCFYHTLLELLHQGQIILTSFGSNTTKGPKKDSYNRQGLPRGIWTLAIIMLALIRACKFWQSICLMLIDWCLTWTWAVFHHYCILCTNHVSVINTDYWVRWYRLSCTCSH